MEIADRIEYLFKGGWICLNPGVSHLRWLFFEDPLGTGPHSLQKSFEIEQARIKEKYHGQRKVSEAIDSTRKEGS